jgi:hypothetical protein
MLSNTGKSAGVASIVLADSGVYSSTPKPAGQFTQIECKS